MTSEIKFRAVIPEKNAKIHFTFEQIIGWLSGERPLLFSFREILLPWLIAGNKPDRYIGIKDKNNVEIYEGDIIRANYNGVKEVFYIKYAPHNACYVANDKIDDKYYGLPLLENGIIYDSVNGYPGYEIMGNIQENQELLVIK